MKWTRLPYVCLVLSFTAFGQTPIEVLDRGEDGIDVTVTTAPARLEKTFRGGRPHTTVAIPELENFSGPGGPELPRAQIHVLVPARHRAVIRGLAAGRAAELPLAHDVAYADSSHAHDGRISRD